MAHKDDTHPILQEIKNTAKDHQAFEKERGKDLIYGHALDIASKRLVNVDWNTACAMAKNGTLSLNNEPIKNEPLFQIHYPEVREGVLFPHQIEAMSRQMELGTFDGKGKTMFIPEFVTSPSKEVTEATRETLKGLVESGEMIDTAGISGVEFIKAFKNMADQQNENLQPFHRESRTPYVITADGAYPLFEKAAPPPVLYEDVTNAITHAGRTTIVHNVDIPNANAPMHTAALPQYLEAVERIFKEYAQRYDKNILFPINLKDLFQVLESDDDIAAIIEQIYESARKNNIGLLLNITSTDDLKAKIDIPEIVLINEHQKRTAFKPFDIPEKMLTEFRKYAGLITNHSLVIGKTRDAGKSFFPDDIGMHKQLIHKMLTDLRKHGGSQQKGNQSFFNHINSKHIKSNFRKPR
ncbi:MAG: hypothetical protein PHT07_10440 [Paludibacter sp.]|nr:hypothetical protein [Paludibacter sp.]